MSTSSGATVTTENVTNYLRKRFPAEPELEAIRVVPIPGGRSKKTFFISLRGTEVLPADLVMRQDYALRYEGTKVRDEYRPLLRLAEAGLPVPRPLLLEADESALGPPFIFVDRLAGSAPGSYFRLQAHCPGAFRDLARTLAGLHRLPPAELGFTVGETPERNLERIIDQYEKKWRDNAVTSSPLIDYAYSWARRECALDDRARSPSYMAMRVPTTPRRRRPADCRARLGIRPCRRSRRGSRHRARLCRGRHGLGRVPDIYLEAGGRPVPERRVRLAMLLQFLKGTTLVAASGRNFVEGWTREFIKGANAFTGLRLIELRIAALLERFAAV